MKDIPEIVKNEILKAEKKNAWMIVFSPKRMAKRYLGINSRSATMRMTQMLEQCKNNMPDGWFLRKVRYPRKTLYYAIRRVENESDDEEICDNMDRIVPGHTHYV